jgi:hypothetical protein
MVSLLEPPILKDNLDRFENSHTISSNMQKNKEQQIKPNIPDSARFPKGNKIDHLK